MHSIINIDQGAQVESVHRIQLVYFNDFFCHLSAVSIYTVISFILLFTCVKDFTVRT